MSTQPVDTHPDAERVFIDLIRKQLWRGYGTLCLVLVWGVLAQHVQVALERQERWHLQPIDLASVVRSVLEACDKVQVPLLPRRLECQLASRHAADGSRY